jgi:hypothetical protein
MATTYAILGIVTAWQANRPATSVGLPVGSTAREHHIGGIMDVARLLISPGANIDAARNGGLSLPAITNLIFGKEESDRKSSANCVGSSSNSSIPSMKRQILSRIRKGIRNGVLLMVPSVQVGSRKTYTAAERQLFLRRQHQASPQASPMVRASSDVLSSKAALATSGMATYITPDQIFWDLEEFCNEKAKLEAYYKEVVVAPSSMPRRSSSTSSSVLKPVRDLEMSIPELILPASLALTMSPMLVAG